MWEKNSLFVFPAGFVDCVISEVCFRVDRTTGWIGHSFNSTSVLHTERLSKTFYNSRDLMFYLCIIVKSSYFNCFSLDSDVWLIASLYAHSVRAHKVCVWLCVVYCVLRVSPFSFTCLRFTLAVPWPFVKLGGKGSLFVLDSIMSLCDPSYLYFGHMTRSSQVLLPQDALLRHAHHP